MEFFITFGLMFGIFATAFDPRGWGKLGPLAISLIIGLNIHVGSFVTGAAMNPARVFGPAVIENCWKHQYVYWIGDLVGGIGGGCTYQYLFMFRKHSRTTVPSTAGDNHYHRLLRLHGE
jgi:aquaporin TIP